MDRSRSPTAVVVVAAGRGTRAHGEFAAALPLPKQYRELAGQPMLRRTLAVFVGHADVDHVVAVIHADDLDRYSAAASGFGGKLLAPAIGGATRQASVLAGLETLGGLPVPPATVLVHDAARPFADPGLIDRLVEQTARGRGAIAAVPVADTLKRTDRSGVIIDTVDRSGLWRAQTPQAFHFGDLLAAHRRAASSGRSDFTDDAAIAEWVGLEVTVVTGSEQNRKLTSDDDIVLADRYLRAEAALAAGETRSATGFDVHRTMPGDHLMLCGVRIAADFTLEGHSDADVALHALTDAVLGTIGADDIGVHFPPSDSRWRGASSDLFLAHAVELLRARGGELSLLDLTILCERPKIGPFRSQMRERIAAISTISVERVSIKATTTERLGFTGRGEGIAALATATVRLPF